MNEAAKDSVKIVIGGAGSVLGFTLEYAGSLAALATFAFMALSIVEKAFKMRRDFKSEKGEK